MRRGFRPRLILIIAFLGLSGLVSLGVWRVAYVQALTQVAAKGQADLALASDKLEAQMMHVRELAVLLADHPVLQALAAGQGNAQEAEDLLLRTLDKTGLPDAALVDGAGRPLASAFGDEGISYAGLDYFERAMDGALGSGQQVTATGERAFIYAAPLFSPSGQVLAAVIVVSDVERFEASWRGSLPAILFFDPAGQVFISNRSELLLRQRGGSGDQALPPIVARDFAGFDLWEMRAGPYIPQTALHLTREVPVLALTAEALIDVSAAWALALWQAAFAGAAMLVFGVILFVLLDRRRRLAENNLALERRVSERTEALQTANTRLLNEVLERKEAEYALKQAQEELVQAGKLSALGQMSAGISHELNQPLMAIQTFADNGALFLSRDKPQAAVENFGRISELARRAGRIIKNLRAFARQEEEPATRVDLCAAIGAALEMAEGKLERGGVQVDWHPPEAPVWVRGGEVRLQQVMVNLISNAADAMIGAGSEPRAIVISLDLGPSVRVSVRDTGPGIDEPEKIFDPFYTTKPVGAAEGMGLGLSISYGLVQSFGGAISGQNAPDGGAVFTIELQPWAEQEAAE